MIVGDVVLILIQTNVTITQIMVSIVSLVIKHSMTQQMAIEHKMADADGVTH